LVGVLLTMLSDNFTAIEPEQRPVEITEPPPSLAEDNYKLPLSSHPSQEPFAAHDDNPNLDFLRSFAVLLVLVGHLTCYFGKLQLGRWNLLLMGSLGVLFFFVHTCLVLMSSLQRRWNGWLSPAPEKLLSRKVFFLEFMIRRCFRIYPLSITVVVLILAFQLPQATVEPGIFHGFRADGGDIIANLFLVQNLAHRIPLLGPMWSLPYELQMYLFLPSIFLFVRKGRPLIRTFAIWSLVSALALLVAHYQPNPSLLLFAPCFLPGVLAYKLQQVVGLDRLPAPLWPFFVAGLSALFLMMGGPGEHWFAKWGACLSLGLAIPMFAPISNRFLVLASHLVAKYSYGIYLTHFFAIWFAFDYLAAHGALQKAAVFALLTTGLPIVCYHTIEKPMIGVGKRIADRYVAGAWSKVSLNASH
jgi:peptidoglycan/LPS O-acetylase OafA/YrhL